MGIDEVKGSRRAVFLDRDGVINRSVVRGGKPYPPATTDEFEFLPGVPAALESLAAKGFFLCVVTNQPDVARGTQDRAVVEAMHAKVSSELPVRDFYVCYHDDADKCSCRKPKPGLLLAAAAEHGIDLKRSYMVGDRWRDVDCGAAAGCATVFVDRGYSEELRQKPGYTVSDLAAAAAIILEGA